MWNLSLKTAEILLEMAENRLVHLDANPSDAGERSRLARAVRELQQLRDEALPMRARLVTGCPQPLHG